MALVAALVYGAADFAGGMASKRTTTWSVVILSQACGLAVLLIVFPFLPVASPVPSDLWWGAIAGIAGVLGVGFLYRGLAIGRMSVVSPITAVLAAALPVAWGSLRGERAALPAYAGIALALLAVVLVSAASHDTGAQTVRGLPPGIFEALLAGAGFGIMFIVLAHTSAHAGMWPLVAARGASVPLVALAAVIVRAPLRPARGALPAIALAGVFDMSANVLYLLATKFTLLAVAAVLTSLYPAATVLLAFAVLRERLNARQWCGVACAAAGVGLIALR